MKVKIKKLHHQAVIPTYAKDGDAGMDLVAVSCDIDEQNGQAIYGTGLAFEIPQGYVGLIFPRSSIRKTVLSLTNCVGVIDSGYRGEVSFTFRVHDVGDVFGKTYRIGEKIGQIIIMPFPQIELEEVNELSETERGQGGFGSTGA